jgi:hypothetical protein
MSLFKFQISTISFDRYRALIVLPLQSPARGDMMDCKALVRQPPEAVVSGSQMAF